MDEAAAVPVRHPLRIAALAAALAVAVVAAAALGLFLWLRTYAPLDAHGSFAPGPALGADIEPTFGSGGKPVLVPAYTRGHHFDTAFTLRNNGRFAVTVLGLRRPAPGSPLAAVDLFASDSATASADPTHLHRFSTLRLDPGDSAIVVARWRLGCTSAKGEVAAESLPLRYRYLSIFTRTETVELPFAVTVRCEGAPPATP